MVDLTDTPTGAITRLDAALLRRGQTITLRRGRSEAPTATITLKGFVTGFKADEIVPGSGISQNDDKVIISPSSLGGWPGAAPGKDDWCEINGRFRTVTIGRLIKMNDVLVRIELQVKG